jgi:transcription-repair coupling factor (superfamily II helicase)
VYDRARALSEVAQKRLQAIFEAQELGAGFQIALRDLEIRGAGNLLGAEQSGHIAAVGFDLYARLLGESVDRLRALQRGETPGPSPTLEAPFTVDLPLSAHIPEDYVPDLPVRLALYQRLARVATVEEATAMRLEFIDRFGRPPEPVDDLLYIVKVRCLAKAGKAEAVVTEPDHIVVRFGRAGTPRPAGKLPRTVTAGPTQLRVERTSEWPQALMQALELVQPAEVIAAAS